MAKAKSAKKSAKSKCCGSKPCALGSKDAALTPAHVKQFDNAFDADPLNVIRQNAVAGAEMGTMIFNHKVISNIDRNVSNVLDDWGPTNQGGSGRCEGSYGFDSDAAPRPQSLSACATQSVGECGESQRKTVFVTSATYDGNFGTLANADANCQGLADAAGLGGTYKAWLSAWALAIPAPGRTAMPTAPKAVTSQPTPAPRPIPKAPYAMAASSSAASFSSRLRPR